MPQYPSQTTESYQPGRLVAGETQLVTRSYVLAAGQSFARGTVMGVITASGKLTISTTAATDGSQVPFGILIDAYDSTLGDLANCGVFLKGEFNENAIILGTGWTMVSVAAPLRSVGIFLKPAVIVGS